MIREDGNRNKEAVYNAMVSIQKEDFARNCSPSVIYSTLRKEEEAGKRSIAKTRAEMSLRSVHRHLKMLEKEGRIRKIGRGEYSTDKALQARKNVESMYKRILSIAESELKERTEVTFLGKRVYETPAAPLAHLGIRRSLFEQWYGARSAIHGMKDIAKTEANILTNSFLASIIVEIGSTGMPLTIKPGQMLTTTRVDMPLVFFWSLFSKDSVKVDEGIDASMFQNAAQMVRMLLGLIDKKSIDPRHLLEPEAEIVVKVRFSLSKYARNLWANIRLWEPIVNSEQVRKFGIVPTGEYKARERAGKKLFQEIRPDNEDVIDHWDPEFLKPNFS